MKRHAHLAVGAVLAVTAHASLFAHSGPPFPIVTDAVRGPYTISVWTDPDTTDDGSPGGQFWVVIALTPKATPLPRETSVTVSARALLRRSPRDNVPIRSSEIRAVATPVRGDIGNQFAGLVMTREGPYEIRVMIDGPLGPATIDSRVDATYDVRPPAYMLVWYLMPFLLVGFLWTRLLIRRRKLPRKR